MIVEVITEDKLHCDVAVIIAVFNGAKYLAEQCQALANQSFREPVQLNYVDNGSFDDGLAIIKEQRWPSNYCVRIVYASSIKGQVYARNAGAEVTSAKYLLYTDQDDLPQYDWIKEMQGALKSNEAVGGRTLITRSGMLPSERCDDINKGLQVLWGIYPIALGTNFGIRKQALINVGGWKDIGVRAGEDLDLCIRLKMSSIQLAYEKKATVIWRARLNYKSLYLQGFTYGKADVLLFQKYGKLETRKRIGQALNGYFMLFMRLGQAIVVPRQRKEAIHKTGWLLGRTAESIKQKVLYI